MNRRLLFSTVIAVTALVLAGSACSKTAKTSATAPKVALAITSPATGSEAKGNVVSLDVTVSGIEIVKADGDTSGKTGHFHVFIDREPLAAGVVIPKEKGIVHSAVSPIVITGLSAGTHRFIVVIGNGGHSRIGESNAETSVTVLGPTLKAAVPASIMRGVPFSINVTVTGVSLVPAKGDTSGKSGHLHVFIDRDPTPDGQPIPKEPGIIHSVATTIPIPAMTAGDHVVWVVLGDGAHVPFSPAVKHKLTLVVA